MTTNSPNTAPKRSHNKNFARLAAGILAIFLVTTGFTSANTSSADAATLYEATVRCHKIKNSSGNPIVGYISGYGVGKTKDAAKKAAKKDANNKASSGYHVRHCDVKKIGKFSGSGSGSHF